jgi:hypothetical protein
MAQEPAQVKVVDIVQAKFRYIGNLLGSIHIQDGRLGSFGNNRDAK